MCDLDSSRRYKFLVYVSLLFNYGIYEIECVANRFTFIAYVLFANFSEIQTQKATTIRFASCYQAGRVAVCSCIV